MLALFSEALQGLGRVGVRALDYVGKRDMAFDHQVSIDPQSTGRNLDPIRRVDRSDFDPAVDVVYEHNHAFHDDPARARRQGPVLTTLQGSAKNIVLALAFLTPCFGQTQGLIQIYQAIAPTSMTFNNTNPKYQSWAVLYNYSGSGSFSIELDCAEDATPAGGTPTPGTFSACTNTSSGTNPSTSPNYGSIKFDGFTPWVKLNLTVLSSGNMTAVAIGFEPFNPDSGGGSSICTGSPCFVAGIDQTNFTISAGTDVTLVSGTSGKKTYLTRLGLAWDNAASITIREGTMTSTPCDTSTATLDGTYGNTTLTALFQDYGSDVSPLKTTATGLDICAHFSTSVTGGGGANFNQF